MTHTKKFLFVCLTLVMMMTVLSCSQEEPKQTQDESKQPQEQLRLSSGQIKAFVKVFRAHLGSQDTSAQVSGEISSNEFYVDDVVGVVESYKRCRKTGNNINDVMGSFVCVVDEVECFTCTPVRDKDGNWGAICRNPIRQPDFDNYKKAECKFTNK